MIALILLNILLVPLAPILFPVLLFYMMRVNDWPRARRSCTSDTMLHGKTALITGANSGIGKETAKEFARRGARVILACRNLEKAKKAGIEIVSQTGNRNVVVMELDLSDLESIRRFCQQVLKRESHLEILVNNGGVVYGTGRTKQGYAEVIGTNYIGHFLLTHLLSELMKKSAPSRIINVSSSDHARMGKVDLSYCTTTPSDCLRPFQLYPLSKLQLVMHARELGRRLKGTGVTTCSVHPGFVQTNISSHAFGKVPIIVAQIYKLTERIVGMDMISGAQTTLFAALEESIQEDTGKYYDNCREKRPGTAPARDDNLCGELWNATLASLRQNGYLQ